MYVLYICTYIRSRQVCWLDIVLQVETPASQTVDINLGCGVEDTRHKHRVYINTYLGFGSNEALRLYRRQLINTVSNRLVLFPVLSYLVIPPFFCSFLRLSPPSLFSHTQFRGGSARSVSTYKSTGNNQIRRSLSNTQRNWKLWTL